jgi:hypothetical protein
MSYRGLGGSVGVARDIAVCCAIGVGVGATVPASVAVGPGVRVAGANGVSVGAGVRVGRGAEIVRVTVKRMSGRSVGVGPGVNVIQTTVAVSIAPGGRTVGGAPTVGTMTVGT